MYAGILVRTRLVRYVASRVGAPSQRPSSVARSARDGRLPTAVLLPRGVFLWYVVGTRC